MDKTVWLEGTITGSGSWIAMNKEIRMTSPREPSEQPPMPAPTWAPEPPIQEPEPDHLPDETPTPNPDETREPPMQAMAK